MNFFTLKNIFEVGFIVENLILLLWQIVKKIKRVNIIIDFVQNILSKVKPKVDEVIYPNKIFYFIDGQLYIEQDLKNRTFWCRYKDFWSIFESKYDIGYEETRVFLNPLLEEHFKCKDYTTNFLWSIS